MLDVAKVDKHGLSKTPRPVEQRQSRMVVMCVDVHVPSTSSVYGVMSSAFILTLRSQFSCSVT